MPYKPSKAQPGSGKRRRPKPKTFFLARRCATHQFLVPLRLSFPMVDPTSTTWYLLKAEDGSTFGPVPFDQLNAWATAAQVNPLDKVSSDQTSWFKAPMIPELKMDWLVELTSEQLYGPTTLGAVQEFLNLGEINTDTVLINAKDGQASHVRDIESLIIPEEEPEVAETADQPIRTGIRASLQQRIRELEHTLIDERRTMEALQERYEKLEEKYVEIVKNRP